MSVSCVDTKALPSAESIKAEHTTSENEYVLEDQIQLSPDEYVGHSNAELPKQDVKWDRDEDGVTDITRRHK